MSEAQRKIIEEINDSPDEGELERFYRHIGKAIPPWVQRKDQYELLSEYRKARALVAAIEDWPELLQVPEVAEAVAIFKRACEAVELTYETPKRAPKHRALIKAMFTQGHELMAPVYEQGLKLDWKRYDY